MNRPRPLQVHVYACLFCGLMRVWGSSLWSGRTDLNREDILVGPVSRPEFNGHNLLPTIGNVVISVGANACFVRVELPCNKLDTLRILFPRMLDWFDREGDRSCLLIKGTGKPPARGWLALEGPGSSVKCSKCRARDLYTCKTLGSLVISIFLLSVEGMCVYLCVSILERMRVSTRQHLYTYL